MRPVRTHSLHARRIAVMAVLGIGLAPATARAGFPDPTQSTVQNVFIGSWNGRSIPTAVSPCGVKHGESFMLTVRDFSGQTVGGAVIQIPLQGTGLTVTAAQNPGVSVDCTSRVMTIITDDTGVARFTPHFGGYVNATNIPILANGVLLANLPAASPDYDADGRVSLSDFSVFAADYLAVVQPSRSDFDNCPTNRLADLSYFVSQYTASNGTLFAPICP